MERLLWGLGGEKCRPISDPPGSKGTGEGGGGGDLWVDEVARVVKSTVW